MTGKKESSANALPKFRTLGERRGGQTWSTTVGKTCFAFGWSYRYNGQAFVTNRAAKAHAFAYVEHCDERGNRTARNDLFSSRYFSTRTFATARREVKPELAEARAAAEAALAAASSHDKGDNSK